MTATDLYNDLVLHGFSLSVQGGNLILSPSSQLSQAQRLEIKQHKSELLLLLDTNNPHTKGEIKPVLKVVAKSELPKDRADLSYQLEAQVKNESYSPLEDGQLNRKSVTCNQCDHLSFTGSCSRLGKRVNPQAMRECGSFQLLKKERPQIEEVKPYTQDELNRLLNQVAKPLYHHLIDCEQCSLEDTRYCVEGFGLGDTFDCLLLCFDDAADKRYKLMNQVRTYALTDLLN